MKKQRKNKKRMIELNGDIKYTVCGEWFPEVYDPPPGKPTFLKVG